MKPHCEFVVKEFLTSARAFIAKKLIEEYHLSQSRTAKLLGMTQPAVSQYKRDLRGKKKIFENDPKVLEMMDSIAKRLASNELNHDQLVYEFCKICKCMRDHININLSVNSKDYEKGNEV
jgi:predicted transcriptional regulator